MFEISTTLVLASFVAGLLMFFAPCTLPLVPAYLLFMGGGEKNIVRNAIAFVLGFSVVFISLGLLVGTAATVLFVYQPVMARLGGFIIIFLALLLFFDIRPGLLKEQLRFTLPKSLTPGTTQAAFVVGVIFALGWTPCIGPVLGTVLLMATNEGTIISGAFLLLVFSLGQAIPFILVAVFYDRLHQRVSRSGNLGVYVTKIGALFLLGVGVLLVSGEFGLLIEYGYRIFDWLGASEFFGYL